MCVVCAQVEQPAEVKEVIGQKRLADKVTGILERIEKELDTVDSKIGEAMHILDTDNDGMVRVHICACFLKRICRTQAHVCTTKEIL